MTDKIREIKKAVLLMLALAIGVLAGAAPGAVLVSHAETETVAAAADPAGAETASEEMTAPRFCCHFSGESFCDPLRRRDCHCNCHQYGGSCRSTGRDE